MPRITISENGTLSPLYKFDLPLGGKINIGRGEGNGIRLEGKSSSTNHCDIKRVHGGYILRDKESTNGVLKEGSRMKVVDLAHGTEVLVGDATLHFQLSEEEAEALKGEPFTPHEKKTLPAIEEPPLRALAFSMPAAPSSIAGVPTIKPHKKSSKNKTAFIVGLGVVIAASALYYQIRVHDGPSSSQAVNETKGTPTQVEEVEIEVEKTEVAIAQTETTPAPKQPYLRRGVEVDLEIEGLITSYQHRTRKELTCYTLRSFDGIDFDLPRFGRNTTPGVSLDGYAETFTKVKVSLTPAATGDIHKVPVTMLLGLEKMDQREGQKRLEEYEKKNLAQKTRTLNPSPNALPYSGTWGVRMAIPSEKNGADRVENFDVNAFAKQIAQLKTVTHVIINVTQPSGPCYFTAPHPELEKVLNTRSHFSNTEYPSRGSFPKRDLLGEVLDAVKATGKKALVYFACEGYHTPLANEELQVVWFNHIESLGMDHYEAVGKLILAHYAERYGKKIDGWWFDGSGGLRTPEQRLMWRNIVLASNPKAIMAFNRMAGPPFKSTAQCDYFGGHPTPRSRNKFWEDVNLPMITAVEASPWMNVTGAPLGAPKISTLGHVFMGLQDRWTLGGCAFPPDQAIDWTSRVVSAGGMYTWSVPCAGSEISAKQFSLLKKIDQAIEKLRKK